LLIQVFFDPGKKVVEFIMDIDEKITHAAKAVH
jgi:hypothetical protein